MALSGNEVILVMGNKAQTFATLTELAEVLGVGTGGGVTPEELNAKLANYTTTTDLNTQLALKATVASVNLKADKTAVDLKADKTSLNKAGVGLGNVDNTTDAAKPVSTAQKAALDKKLDIPTNVVPTEGATLSWNDTTKKWEIVNVEGV